MTAYQDRSADIAAAEAEANRLWGEAYVAYVERRNGDGHKAAKLSARYASVARRLAWIPERREDTGEAAA